MSVGQLGDSLIYIVLPVSAELFGLSILWVGVLLAANRIIRTFTYGLIAHIGERIGLRTLCVAATVTSVLSTAAYGLVEGPWWLLTARCIWGLSYAALLLAALGYAAADRSRTGARVGVSRAIEQIGPLAALTLGAWLAGAIGPKGAFLWMAVGTLAACGMALALPRLPISPPRSRRPLVILPKPQRLDLLIFWMGAGADGVFMMTITLMLSRYVSVELAMLTGGGIVGLRRVAEMFMGPISGSVSDRFGVHRPMLVASTLMIVGLFLIGIGWLFSGAVAMVIARGALGTLLPAAVAKFASGSVLTPLARNATWRDIGAAAGPLLTGGLLLVATPEQLHLGIALGFAATLLWVVRWPVWRESACSQLG